MKRIPLIQGAHMEWLGQRQPELYGMTTVPELDAGCGPKKRRVPSRWKSGTKITSRSAPLTTPSAKPWLAALRGNLHHRSRICRRVRARLVHIALDALLRHFQRKAPANA